MINVSKEINLTKRKQDMYFDNIHYYGYKYLFCSKNIKQLSLNAATYDMDSDNYVKDYVRDKTNWNIVADYTDTTSEALAKFRKGQTYEQRIVEMKSEVTKILDDIKYGSKYDVLIVDDLPLIAMHDEELREMLEELFLNQVVVFCVEADMFFGLENSNIDAGLMEPTYIELCLPFKSSYDF